MIEIQEAIDALHKSGLMELKAMAKPHPLIEKTLQIVCALKGLK